MRFSQNIKFQKSFLDQISAGLPKNQSLNEAVAIALDISYDAAHRRNSLKAKLSLDETILLANYFNISLDALFGQTAVDYLSVVKTKQITSEAQLQHYFENSYVSLKSLLKDRESIMYYSAKDIPIFYTLTNSKLTKFKIYVWLKLLGDPNWSDSFEAYTPALQTTEAAQKLGSVYQEIPAVEIWDITTVNSTLKQIHFYFKAGLLQLDSAIYLCEDLKKLIDNIAHKVMTQPNFKLYYNELLLMNNNVFVKTPRQQAHYVPFTILSYYRTSDKQTCKQAMNYLTKQMNHSKLLNAAGEKERLQFFNIIYAKIAALKQLLSATQELDFE